MPRLINHFPDSAPGKPGGTRIGARLSRSGQTGPDSGERRTADGRRRVLGVSL
jgi:hypothetical protein